MADLLPEHKGGGDEGKSNNVVPLRDEPPGLQCAPPGVCGKNSHQNEESTLHSSQLQQGECGSITAHPNEGREAKSSEEAPDNPGRLVVKDGIEKAEASKKQEDEVGCGLDESKLAKANVAQAKDPPDRENSQAEGKMLVTEQNELPCHEGVSDETVSVSTKSSEIPLSLNNSTSEHPSSVTPLPEAVLTGDALTKSGTPTETNTSSAVGCQESSQNLSKPTSVFTEKPPGKDLSSIVSSDPQEKLTETLTESQSSSKSSLSSAYFDSAGIEGSSTQSSTMSSASDLCPTSEVEHSVVDSPSQSSLLASVSKSSSSPTLTSSAPLETANKTTLLLSQSQVKETEPHSQTSKAQCPEGYLSAENESQIKVSIEKNGDVTEGEKILIGSEVPDNTENLIGQSEMQVEQNQSCNDVNMTSETGTETLPMIVATHSLSKEQSAEKEYTDKGEPTASFSVKLEATKKIVPLLESEPLKPVTIGSSLQPLEEVQEASMVEDTSFTTDMAIMDSSADEADSIGGLVINNVIGAADGVVDFQPDEVETEKELTDISASAPQLGESDLGDEHGPSAKRRRLENEPNGVEDKSNSAKKVILKVIPVKNGHGVWDSQKLQEVLLTKGTILLQIHASKESMELFEPDKNDRKIDFTAIMAETKDDDHDHVISFGNVDPECDDPLAVGNSHPDTASVPPYGRTFSQSHIRSTALQPAMSRPGFKHLQTPQQYHMKNEMLGLPPPLEFEEPQMGSSDWSGMDTHTVAFPESQASPHSPVEESLLPHSPGPESKISRVKVCPECGMVFYKTQSYVMHVRSHKPMLDCDECSYKTKDPKKLKTHQLTHKKRKPDKECYICHKYFLTDITLRIHQKKIHGVHMCRYCTAKYSTDEEMKNHMREQHGYTRKTKACVVARDPKQKFQTSNETADIDKRQLICRFCEKVCKNEYLLNLHLQQHFGTVSKKIGKGILDKSDDVQKHKKISQILNESTNSKVEFESPVSPMTDTFNASVKCEVISDNDADNEDKDEAIPPACNTFESPSTSLGQTLLICNPVGQSLPNTTLQSPISSATSELMRPEVIPGVGNPAIPNIPSGQSLLFCNPVGQPLSLMRPHFILPPPTLSTTDELTGSPYTQATAAACAPSAHPTAFQYDTTPVPEVKPSTSFSSSSQTSAKNIFIPAQENQVEKDKEYSPFWCVHCSTVFPTPDDLKKHFWEVHPSQPIPKILLPRVIKNPIYEECKRFVRKRHKVKRELPCDVCGEVYYTSKQLRNHKKKHRKSFICPDCNTIYKSSHKLIRHQKLIHKDKYRCRFACGNLFDSYSEVINHYKKVHDKDYSRIECPHCHKGFVYEASLMNHLEKCTDCPPDKRPAHVCGNCEGFFSNIDAYNKHARICLPSLKKKDESKNNAESTPNIWAVSTTKILENYESPSDNDSTSDSNESNIEQRNANKPYEFRHRRSTTTEYSSCKYCPNMFIEKDKEVSHILSWHRDMVASKTDAPRKCEICGIIFKIDKSLCKHLLMHYTKLSMWNAFVPENILKLVTVKNYCWICKSIFKWPQNTDHGVGRDLRIDEALEIEEFDETLALKCEECNQSYTSRKEFWRHVKNHISVLPCRVFDSRLPQSRIHSNSFECAECQYKCRNMNELYKHLTVHFMEEVKEKIKVGEKTDKDSSSMQIIQDAEMDSINVQTNQDAEMDSINMQTNQDANKDSIYVQTNQDADKDSINVKTNQDADKDNINVQTNQDADKDTQMSQVD